MAVIWTLDGPYTLTPEEEAALRAGLSLAPGDEPCRRPLPSPTGTGVCLRCGWQHARRGPGALERLMIRAQREEG